MKAKLRRPSLMLGAALILAAASLIGAHALAGAATATTRQPAPIWLGTAETITIGHSLLVEGVIDVKADLGGAVVKLYKRQVGQNTNTYVGKASVVYSMFDGNTFYAHVSGLRRNCIITAVWGGNSKYFGSRTWMFAGVRPRVSIAATLATQERTRLRIDIAPVQPAPWPSGHMPEQLATVECFLDGVWKSFPAEISVASTDGESWCVYNYADVAPGTYTVRANFKGTNYNAARPSKTLDIVVP